MVINDQQYVGIGIASPPAVLSVNANTTYNVDASYAIEALDSSNTQKRLALGYADAYGGVINLYNSGSAYQNTLINPSAGNVGIGTTNPVYTLQVAGSVAGSSAYVNTSDERYKKNIAPLQFGFG